MSMISVTVSFLRSLLNCLWLFLPGVLTLLISYFLFTSLSQGQDVLIQTSEYSGPAIWSAVGIFIWAHAIWYSSRLISYKKEETSVITPMMGSFLKHFPRFMAFCAFLSIQVAILDLPKIQEFSGIHFQTLQMLTFISINSILYFSISSLLKPGGRNKVWLWLIALLIIIASVIVWLRLFIISVNNAKIPTHVYVLSLYGLILFIVMILSLYFFIKRRTTGNTDVNAEENHIKLTKNSRPIFRTGRMDERKLFTFFGFVFLVGTCLYACNIKFIFLADRFGALAFIMTAFGFLVSAANIIVYFSLRWRINLFFFLILITFFIGKRDDPYKITKIPNKNRVKIYAGRPTILEYFNKWIKNDVRRDKILKDTFDVYVELADGGASRSGYWVASVLSALEDASRKEDKFSNHLFSLSSASGGSVGNSTFYSLLSKDTNPNYTLRAQKFLSTDFLTFLMSHFLGPDFWGHYYIFHDRAWAIEAVMDSASDSLYNGAFTNTVDSYFDTSGRLPILFINTTEVQHGQPAVISSVKLDDFSARLDVLKMIDENCPGYNIQLSTAAIMSSRFPYISPAGELGNLYFVDGGYFDNSGAGITSEMFLKIDSVIKNCKTEDTLLYNHLRFHLMHITNTPIAVSPISSISSVTNNIAAPLLTVLNTYSSQTNVNDGRLIHYFNSDLCRRHIVDSSINLYKDAYTEDFPMDWVISDYFLDSMNSRVAEEISKFKAQGKYGLDSNSDSVKMYKYHPSQFAHRTQKSNP